IAVGLLSQLNVADQARILSRLDARQQAQILRQLNESSLVYAFMPLGQQLNVAQHLSISELVSILDAMPSDDFVDIYKQFSPPLQLQLMGALSEESQQTLKGLAIYPEGTAGAMRSSRSLTLSADLRIDEGLQALRMVAGGQHSLCLIYIVDVPKRMIGVISLRQIIHALPELSISEVMQRKGISAQV